MTPSKIKAGRRRCIAAAATLVSAALVIAFVPMARPAHASAGSKVREILLSHREELRSKVQKAPVDQAAGDLIDRWLEGQGVRCPKFVNDQVANELLGLIPLVSDAQLAACYIQGSGDAYTFSALRAMQLDLGMSKRGVIQSNGPGLRFRITPNRSHEPLRVLPDGWTVVIMCQVHGETVTGPFGESDVWNYIGDEPGTAVTRFVSDASVRTGSNGFVTPECPDSVAGSGLAQPGAARSGIFGQ